MRLNIFFLIKNLEEMSLAMYKRFFCPKKYVLMRTAAPRSSKTFFGGVKKQRSARWRNIEIGGWVMRIGVESFGLQGRTKTSYI
jgi:hypothetical protein